VKRRKDATMSNTTPLAGLAAIAAARIAGRGHVFPMA
jgi:hypothetical protein